MVVVRRATSFGLSPAFTSSYQRHATERLCTQTKLFGKGFKGVKNKQASLAEKMRLAKKQQRNNEETSDDDSDAPVTVEKAKDDSKTNNGLSLKEDSAHAEFAKLLANSKPPPKSSTPRDNRNPTFGPVAPGSNMAKFSKLKKPKQKVADKEQKSSSDKMEPEIDDTPLRQGDKARRRDFENLVDVNTGKALGPVRAAGLAPWVPPFVVDYLVILADPRPQSSDWRRGVEYLQSTFCSGGTSNNEDRIRFMSITAEPPKETTAWMARTNVQSNNDRFCIFQDVSEWMTSYGCLDSPSGWSLHVLVIDNDGVIQIHQGGVDPSQVCSIVTAAVLSTSGSNNRKQKKKMTREGPSNT